MEIHQLTTYARVAAFLFGKAKSIYTFEIQQTRLAIYLSVVPLGIMLGVAFISIRSI